MNRFMYILGQTLQELWIFARVWKRQGVCTLLEIIRVRCYA